MVLTKYFRKFFRFTQSSGNLLLLCVFCSLFIANSSFGSGFQGILDFNIGPYTTSQWINDGLMTIFFLLVGLEIKRELIEGELSNIKRASLPILAAIGGMLIPALIFTLFTVGTSYQKGWGIPMATDIAFSLAILSMLGKRIPNSLKIFLTALAIVDDLGAIVIIALFYTEKLEMAYLLYSGGIFLFLIALNYLKVTKHLYYLLPGVLLWYCMHHSGIHATIAGVLLAFTIPTNQGTTITSPLEKLEEKLHVPVAYFIMPLFALANTNIQFHNGMIETLFSPFSLGIMAGLVLGKVIGINLFSYLAIRLQISELPTKSNWSQMLGIGLLAGIGFTMSIFIALLSYRGHPQIQEEAKLAILVASGISGFLGYGLLKGFAKKILRSGKKAKG